MLERIKWLYFSHCSKRFWPRTNLPHSPVACDSASPGSARALAGLQLDCSIHLCWQGSPTKQCRCQGYAVAGAELVTGSCHCGLLVFEFASRPGTCERRTSGQRAAARRPVVPATFANHGPQLSSIWRVLAWVLAFPADVVLLRPRAQSHGYTGAAPLRIATRSRPEPAPSLRGAASDLAADCLCLASGGAAKRLPPPWIPFNKSSTCAIFCSPLAWFLVC